MSMRLFLKAIAPAAALIAVPCAFAGVVFNEPFTGAVPVGSALTVPGPSGTLVTSAYTYFTTGGAIPPTIQITNFSGDLRLENTAAANTQEAHIVTPVTSFAIDRAVTVEFDAYDPTNAATSNQRFYVLVRNGTTGDGYRVRMSSQNISEEVVNATIFNDNVEIADRKFDDNVEGPGILGTPDVAGAWHVKMSFVEVGTDIKVFYEVTGISPTPNLVAFNSFTFTEALYPGVTNVDDNFDQVDIWTRRPLGSMDNVVVSTDTTAPVITLLGSPTVTLTCGDSYTDAGATALDNVEGNITSSIVTVNPVNTAVANVYTITYNVTDLSTNVASQVTRTVTVQDNTDPVVVLTGANPITISCGGSFSDPGATASDTCSGTLTPVVTGSVNTVVPGNYVLTYTATDAATNDASVTRTVTVLNNCPAILITPTTPSSLTLEVSEGPAEFGIDAQGSGTLTYQWFFNDGSGPVSLSGQTTDTLTIALVALTDEGNYYCEVTDDFDTVQSPVFTLNVAPQMPLTGIAGLGFAAIGIAAAGALRIRRKA